MATQFDIIHGKLHRFTGQQCPKCGKRKVEKVVCKSIYWALYQMTRGKIVVFRGTPILVVKGFYSTSRFYIKHGRIIWQNTQGIIEPLSEKEFLGLDNLGWEFYDPSEDKIKVIIEGTISQDSISKKDGCFTLHVSNDEYIFSLSHVDNSDKIEKLLKRQDGKCDENMG